MAQTITAAAQNAAADAIVDLLDVSGPGNIQIATTAFASILATITLANPAFSAASSGVCTLLGTPLQDTSADNTGTAAVWRARQSGGTPVISGNTSLTADGSDITLDTIARNAAINAVTALIGASGHIQFATDATFGTPLASLPLNATAFAAASAGAAAMNTSPAPTANASASGTCTAFRFRTSGNTEIWRGSVGTSGQDINFDTNIFANGVPVTLSSYSFTLAASVASSIGVMVLNTLSIVSAGLVQITSGTFTQPLS
jgi:hypothetical protein